MRPSGGIGYTQHSGINLPGIFALRQLGLISQEEVVAEKQNSHLRLYGLSQIQSVIVQ